VHTIYRGGFTVDAAWHACAKGRLCLAMFCRLHSSDEPSELFTMAVPTYMHRIGILYKIRILGLIEGKKGTYSSLRINLWQGYGASPAIWDHTVLPATRHRWTRPALTLAMQAGTRSTYPGGMEGWVDLVTRKRRRWEWNSRIQRSNHWADQATYRSVCRVQILCRDFISGPGSPALYTRLVREARLIHPQLFQWSDWQATNRLRRKYYAVYSTAAEIILRIHTK